MITKADLKETMRMFVIRGDLRFIDTQAKIMDEDPVVLSVSKAFTLAQLHPDIEARVTCKDIDEADKVIQLLAGLARPGDRVSDKECALELPNGSAVLVVVEAVALKGERKS